MMLFISLGLGLKRAYASTVLVSGNKSETVYGVAVMATWGMNIVYPKSAVGSFAYSQYETIGVTYLNKNLGEQLATKLSAGDSSGRQIFNWLVGWVPYFGQVYSIFDAQTTNLNASNAKQIETILKSNKGVCLTTYAPTSSALAREGGGETFTTVSSWNGMISSIKAPTVAAPQYLSVIKNYKISQ